MAAPDNTPPNHRTQVELARLDERMKAAVERMEREEKANQRAIKLASDELARRLDILNHAHTRAMEAQALTVSRELFDAQMKVVAEKLQALEADFREQQGRLWLPLLVAAGIAAGMAALAVKFLLT